MSHTDIAVLVLGGIVVLILLYLVILTRQIALLHLRLQPTGARVTDMGPDIGVQLEQYHAQDINGQDVLVVGGQRARLLLFVSPNCSVCHDLMPSVKAISKSYRRGANSHEIVLISVLEERSASLTYAQRHGIRDIPIVASATLAELFRIASTPYAVAIDENGVVKAKGIVNNVEHLESLFIAPAIVPNDGDGIVAEAVTLTA